MKAIASEDPRVDCRAGTARIVAVMLQTDDFRREQIGTSLKDALDLELNGLNDGCDF